MVTEKCKIQKYIQPAVSTILENKLPLNFDLYGKLNKLGKSFLNIEISIIIYMNAHSINYFNDNIYALYKYVPHIYFIELSLVEYCFLEKRI